MIKNILKGWYRRLFNKNKELANKRLKICQECPNRLKLNSKVSICKLCGCELDAKARVEDEVCHDGKW